MKMLGLIFGLMIAMARPSSAVEATFEIAYSSFASVGVKCSTGTQVRINATRPTGFTSNIAGYRIINQNATYAAFLGGPSVSTSTAGTAAANDYANLGERVGPRASDPFPVGKGYISTGGLVPVYCMCEDAAGANGCILSVVWFGY